jgi:very-short-patch-repair endonuclease
MARAQGCRLERLRNRTRAEMAFAELIDRHRILYEVEKLFLNGDRWILVDFYLKDRMLAIELDGSVHDNQKEYDRGRDDWLLRQYGVRTFRLSNAIALNGDGQALGTYGIITV